MAFQGYFLRVKDKKIVEFLDGAVEYARDLIPVSETEYHLAYATNGDLLKAITLLMNMKSDVENWEDHYA